jgi:phosphoserine phosphatase
MPHVLSLIAAKAKAPLRPEDIDAAQAALAATTATAGPADWLSPDEAIDIPFDGDPLEARKSVRAALGRRPIDVNVVPAEARRKKLLLADMDSTMIEQECIDELAAEVGLREHVAAITARAMRGEIAFAPALRERVALLKGLPVAVAERVLSTRIRITPGAETLIATMRAGGAHTMLVSGGFTAFVEPVARMIGFHEMRANVLQAEAGAFVGTVVEPILDSATKEATLAELIARHAIEAHETLAVGDGANDAAMVKAAGLGVAFRAKPTLRAVADAEIEHADLTGLLFLQGYRREEFRDGVD